MHRTLLFAFSLCLVLASSASADVPRPPSTDTKVIPPRVRFDGVDQYADYVFVLKYNSGDGRPFAAPPWTLEVRDSKAFTLYGTGNRIVNMHILVLERKDYDKRKAENPKLDWLIDKTPGVLKAALVAPSTTGSVKDSEIPVTVYRVLLKKGKLSVENIGKENRRSEGGAGGPVSIGAVGVACALSIISLGLWFVRRQAGSGKRGR
jgi:hypothetical protein